MLRLDRRRRLQPLALQTAEAARLLADMPEQRRMSSWHLVDPSGGVASAGLAISPLLRLLPGGAGPAALAARLPGAMQRLYGWVAGHRSEFGRLVTAGAKTRADALIARRSGERADAVS